MKIYCFAMDYAMDYLCDIEKKKNENAFRKYFLFTSNDVVVSVRFCAFSSQKSNYFSI